MGLRIATPEACCAKTSSAPMPVSARLACSSSPLGRIAQVRGASRALGKLHGGENSKEGGTFKAKGNRLGDFGLPFWPALSLPSQMRMNVRPSPASVPMVAASTQWEASSVIAMRVSIPAPPSLSAMVSVTRNKQGEQRLVKSGTGVRSGTLKRHVRNCCTIINIDA